MKLLRSIVILLLAAASFAAIAWIGLHQRTGQGSPEGKPGDDEKKDEKAEAGVVHIKREVQERIGLSVVALESATHTPELPAYGHVMDPTPLVTLDGELATAEAALDASRLNAERSRGLFQSGENVARKALETAEAQLRTDQSRARSLRRQFVLEWGESLSRLESTARERLIDDLVSGATVLLHVDAGAGQSLGEIPPAARVVVVGREAESLPVAEISYATSVDPKTQAQGFLLRLEHPPFPLRPGGAATAYLALKEQALVGVSIPRESIIYSNGAAWAYVQTAPETFVRRKVALDHPAPDGIFVGEGFVQGDRIVTTGAQSLLSEEQKGAGGAAD